MLSFEFDTSQILKELERTAQFIEKEVPITAGNLIASQIKTLTFQGKDAQGITFKPYKPTYAEYRRKHGKQVNLVNLVFTGALMAGIEARWESGTVVVSPDGDLNTQIAQGLMKDRNFFDVAPDTYRNFEDVITRQYNSMMGR